MTQATPKPFTEMTRDEKIMAWNEAKATLEAAKATEMEMRKHIVETQFKADEVGTQNIELGRGYKLKAVVKQNYKLDTDNDKVDEALDRLEDWQAERLVKWKGTLSVSEYKKLEPAEKAIIDKVVTTSFSSPTLELVAPKAPPTGA